MIYCDAFKMFENLMSVILEKSFIRMVVKLLQRYFESVLLKFVRPVPTRKHFISLTLQHRVFLTIHFVL